MKKEKKHIELVPYDPSWPKRFEEEAAYIMEILGEKCLALHHIGSTSIAGLSAKPDIDIICVIDFLDSSLVLQEFGYAFKGELNIPLRYYENLGYQRMIFKDYKPGISTESIDMGKIL